MTKAQVQQSTSSTSQCTKKLFHPTLTLLTPLVLFASGRQVMKHARMDRAAGRRRRKLQDQTPSPLMNVLYIMLTLLTTVTYRRRDTTMARSPAVIPVNVLLFDLVPPYSKATLLYLLLVFSFQNSSTHEHTGSARIFTRAVLHRRGRIWCPWVCQGLCSAAELRACHRQIAQRALSPCPCS